MAAEATTNGNSETQRVLPRLRKQYDEVAVPALREQFGYTNLMQVPKIQKVVINIGMGESIGNGKALDNAVNDIQLITGQKPVITRAKRSIAQFKLRAGMPIGVMVTLRGARMYEFVDRLFNIAMPRVRDFRGLSPDSFDGRGNYTLGLKEQLIFPEIEYDKIDRVRGMEISFVTSAKTMPRGGDCSKCWGCPTHGRRARRAASSASRHKERQWQRSLSSTRRTRCRSIACAATIGANSAVGPARTCASSVSAASVFVRWRPTASCRASRSHRGRRGKA